MCCLLLHYRNLNSYGLLLFIPVLNWDLFEYQAFQPKNKLTNTPTRIFCTFAKWLLRLQIVERKGTFLCFTLSKKLFLKNISIIPGSTSSFMISFIYFFSKLLANHTQLQMNSVFFDKLWNVWVFYFTVFSKILKIIASIKELFFSALFPSGFF